MTTTVQLKLKLKLLFELCSELRKTLESEQIDECKIKSMTLIYIPDFMAKQSHP